MAKLTDLNCLATLRPELAKQWSFKNKLTSHEVTCGSHKKVLWECEFGHEYEAVICDRTSGNGCPCCSGRKACKDNCLANIRPELIKYWNKDNKLTPFDVTCGSCIEVSWNCDNGHVYKAAIKERTRGRSCPFCAGNKACKDNCLAILNPNLALEWDYERSFPLTPNDVTVNSGKRVGWECELGHKYDAVIKNRNKGSGCPVCNESKGEKQVSFVLNSLKINFDRQHRFEDCRNKGKLPFDFGVLNEKQELLSLIEYQGIQHYEPVSFNGKCGVEGYKTTVINDKIKLDYCIKNKIPLLRIPYWDFNKIEELIKEFLKYE